MSLDDYLTNKPGRCPECGVHIEKQAGLHVGGCLPTGEAGKAEGMARALAASPSAEAKVTAAILRLASKGGEFSANDVREVTGITGPVVGATFNSLRMSKRIKTTGQMVRSTDTATHGHRINVWRAA